MTTQGTELVIDISSFGKVTAMHTEAFPLGFLGAQQIVRASDIRHDKGTQSWGIWLATYPNGKDAEPEYLEPTYPAIKGFCTYDEAVAFEVDWLNACRKDGAPPESDNGKQIAVNLRSVW